GASAQQICPPSSRFAPGDFNGAVNAVAVFDDGSGPALYAAGSFTTASGKPCNRIARWNGQRWEPLGLGVNNAVLTMVVHDDDGEGPTPPALYIGGQFSSANGVPCNRIARWNGTTFTNVGNADGN